MSEDTISIEIKPKKESPELLEDTVREESSTLMKQIEFVNIKTEPPCDTPADRYTEVPVITSSIAYGQVNQPIPVLPQLVTFSVKPSEWIEKDGRESLVKIKVEQIDDEYEDNDDRVHIPVEVNIIEGSSSILERALSENSSPSGKFMCPICHKRFEKKGLVHAHQLLHNTDRHSCESCGKEFVRKELLQRHILIHLEKKYCCPECDKKFKTSSNLEQHKRVHMDVKPFQCDVCFKSFAIKAYMLKHQTKSRCKKPLGPLICDICDKHFEKAVLLKSHLRKHSQERPFGCEQCDMMFKYKSTLLRHLQMHNNERPFKCKYCPKTFTHAGLIKPHLRIHTGEKPYQCPICLKCFTHKHNMIRHSVRHNKVKNLNCDICFKKFPKESRLIYHMKTHTNERPFACDQCPKKFSHRQNIKRHYVRKHPNAKYTSTDTDASVAKSIASAIMIKPQTDVAILP